MLPRCVRFWLNWDRTVELRRPEATTGVDEVSADGANGVGLNPAGGALRPSREGAYFRYGLSSVFHDFSMRSNSVSQPPARLSGSTPSGCSSVCTTAA